MAWRRGSLQLRPISAGVPHSQGHPFHPRPTRPTPGRCETDPTSLYFNRFFWKRKPLLFFYFLTESLSNLQHLTVRDLPQEMESLPCPRISQILASYCDPCPLLCPSLSLGHTGDLHLHVPSSQHIAPNTHGQETHTFTSLWSLPSVTFSEKPPLIILSKSAPTSGLLAPHFSSFFFSGLSRNTKCSWHLFICSPASLTSECKLPCRCAVGAWDRD